MHPIFRQPARLLLYLALWMPIGVLLAAVLAFVAPQPFLSAWLFAVPLALFYALVCLAAWWVCRARPLGVEPGAAAALAQFGAAAQSAAVWAAVAAGWGWMLAHAFGVGPGPGGLTREVVAVFLAGLPLYLASAMVHYLLFALEASHEAAELALEAQVAAREAELRAVRAQLNPHFLFNSLNSINALVGNDPEGARRMCEGLGDFLRRTLALGARSEVSLGDELALVDRYLAIEQVRFGERLRVERAVDPRATACALPPLLLQPLVENAIKHGVAGRIEGGVLSIAAERKDGRLVVALENPVDADAPARVGEGLGLDIVRRRLAALSGADARLDVARAPGRFKVTLDLPAVEAAQS